jgi:hypothetical protein
MISRMRALRHTSLRKKDLAIDIGLRERKEGKKSHGIECGGDF